MTEAAGQGASGDPGPGAPWYERYFTADYWAYAVAEYDPARTASEVDYLAGVLDADAPGRRVLELCCGMGRHSIGLARRGFEMVGVDVSQYSLTRADAAARDAEVKVTWHRADLLAPWEWAAGTDPFDAVICVQGFGWGEDADQLRVLQRARAVLRPGGVMVLDHSNISAILRMYRSEDAGEVNGHWIHFLRRYDATTGRSSGEVRVRRPDGTNGVIEDDVRMYQPPEVRALLERAGFEVSRVDANFVAGAAVDMDTRYVQFVARVAPRPEPALAGHRAAAAPGAVELRWAPDEVEWIRGALDQAWNEVAESGGLADRSRRYDLTDPYGAERATPVLSGHFGVELDQAQVTAGAGATGLLRGLAGLAAGGTVLTGPFGHPELAEAAAELTAAVRVTSVDSVASAVRSVEALGPSLVVLDRPTLEGDVWSTADLRALAAAVAGRGGVLVVDETCASYLPAADSAVPLVDEVEGLVVVRSLSKGYCCGGLRVGFAIATPDVAARVRAVCPPLATSALSFDVGLALLRRADALDPLRERIATVKPDFVALLEAAGLHPRPGHPLVPWVTLPADDQEALAARGLVGKQVPALGRDAALLRVSVPLSAQRWQDVRAALSDVSREGADAAG